MGLVDALRRAEEQARKAARASAERTVVSLDDAERAIRRRMRVYPKQVRAIPLRSARATAAGASTLKSPSIPEDQPLNSRKAG